MQLLEHNKYWDDQLRKAIEGWWVFDKGKDGKGTWVFMMPPLYWHINIFVGPLDDGFGNKLPGKLHLTDREMISFTYLLCCDGFSGFLDDDIYTCNDLVPKIANGDKLSRLEQRRFEACKHNLYNKEGKLKKYVERWEYLTRTYLIDDVQGKPLGLPLYDNVMSDGFMFGSRGSAKSLIIASYTTHTYYLGGIKRWEDRNKMHKLPLLVGVGSGDSGKVDEFAKYLQVFDQNMPGRLSKDGIEIGSPISRILVGQFENGSEIIHRYQDRETKDWLGSLSKIRFRVYQKHTPAIFVGGRWKLIVEDEVGLNPDVETTIGAERASTDDLINGTKDGKTIRMGTSGFIEHIEGSKNVFNNPERYGVYGIPNYWEKPDKKIGLFISYIYVNNQNKDEQGNTILEDALTEVEDIVAKMENNGSSGQNIKAFQLNRPILPSQMFIDGKFSLACSEHAKIRRAYLSMNPPFMEIGWLERDHANPKNVIFKPDPQAIVSDAYNSKTTKVEKNQGVIIYEQPIKGAPYGLYKTVYDPVLQDGLGKTNDASLCSVLVHKGFDYSKAGKQNNIVARWYYRREDNNENHERAVLLADFYGSTIMHEDDIGRDFITYCKTRNRHEILASTPDSTNSLKITGNALHKVGMRTGDPDMKANLLKTANDWLLRERGLSTELEFGGWAKNIDELDDMLLLDEFANFSAEGNFDNLSAFLILMGWIRSETEKVFTVKEEGNRKNDSVSAFYKMAQRNLGYALN